ncbi:hypothetical protein MMC12_005625 [Toensbergia leucococca]|nr:hypothetical protein [Toensbergia leucococca]
MSSSIGLVQLSYELLDNIVRRLDSHGIKTIRLTSQRLHQVASPLLFQRIFISSHPLDLDVFNRITSNSILQKNIRELIWDDTTLNQVLMTWEIFVSQAEHSWPNHPAEYTPSRGAFDFWVGTTKDHHVIRSQHLDQRSLMETLPKLSSLESVILTNRNVEALPSERDFPEAGSSPTTRQWLALPEKVPFPPRVDWLLTNADSEAFDGGINNFFNIDFYDDGWPAEEVNLNDSDYYCVYNTLRPFRGLLILLRALSNTGTRIKKFMIRPSYEKFRDHMPGISHVLFQKWSPDLDCFVDVVKHLRVLHLVISSDEIGSGKITARLGHLTRLLRAAAQLEDLSLEMTEMPTVGVLDPSYTYPYLRKARFLEGNIDPERFLTFLRNHRATLQNLELYYCHLEISTWETTVALIKQEQLTYKHCIFHHVSDNTPLHDWMSASENINELLMHNGHFSLARGDMTPPPRFEDFDREY